MRIMDLQFDDLNNIRTSIIEDYNLVYLTHKGYQIFLSQIDTVDVLISLTNRKTQS